MRGDQHRGARAVDALEQVHDAAGGLGVEVARGLVAHQKRRAVDDGARDGDALLLAAGELVGHLVELLLQADQAQDLGDLRLDDVAALSDDLQRERDVLEDGLVRQQLEVLEHAADVAAQVRHAPVAHRREVLARDVDMALRRLHLADEHADEGGLARARMTHQEDELAGVDLQRDIRQGGSVGLGGIHFGHMVERDDRGARLLGDVIDLQHGQGLRQLGAHLSLARMRTARSAGTLARRRLGGCRLVDFVRHRMLRSYSDVLRQP